MMCTAHLPYIQIKNNKAKNNSWKNMLFSVNFSWCNFG